jgi:hypothetical protein
VSSPGFGAYTFRVLGDLDALDKNVVLGLFTWDTYAPEYNYREIDFEASRWGNAADPTNCQFVVQPWNTPGNLVRFTVAAGETTTTQTFTWSADSVSFASWSGFGPRPQSVTYAYAYGGADVPPQGSTTANTRCNLWLINGTPPSNGQEVEMVIAGFTQGDPAVPVGIPGPAAGRVLSLGLSANPSRGQVRIGVEGPDGGPVTLEIVDARGRRVWSTVVTADHGQPLWAGRDTEGRAVAPGIYFVRATRGANQATIRLTRLP